MTFRTQETVPDRVAHLNLVVNSLWVKTVEAKDMDVNPRIRIQATYKSTKLSLATVPDQNLGDFLFTNFLNFSTCGCRKSTCFATCDGVGKAPSHRSVLRAVTS